MTKAELYKGLPPVGSRIDFWEADTDKAETAGQEPSRTVYTIVKYYPHVVHMINDSGLSRSPTYFEFKTKRRRRQSDVQR